MFQHFTPEARRALDVCHVMARGDRAGTEHLLLGLIDEWLEVAEAVREELGVDLADLHARIGSLEGTGSPLGSPLGAEMEPRYAPDARRALMFAQDESWRLDDLCIGTEHLLLGLIREPQGGGGRVLREAGLALDGLRRRVVIVKSRPLPGEDPGATAIGA